MAKYQGPLKPKSSEVKTETGENRIILRDSAKLKAKVKLNGGGASN